MMEQEHLIELKNVSKEFDGTTVLSDIDLYIRKKEFLTLLGPSGCGKTTTLRMIAGFEDATSGIIKVQGERVENKEPYQRDVNTVFQNYALFPNMTVRQNILCGMRHIKDKAEKEARLNKYVSMFRLEGLENHRPAQLSGGQAQRTALARIMVSDPKLLLLDEPFSALDAHLRDKLMIEMRDVLARFGREVIMVTHSRDEAYNMSREIAVMDSGKLLIKNKTKALFADPGSVPAAILTGCKNIASAEKRGEHEVYIPEWGVTLTTAQSVGDDVKAIGIRAHYFNPTAPTNRFAVEYIDEMEEPFEWIIEFRPRTAAADAQGVWWRLSKDKRPQSFPAELGIAPANILLLY